ncbi:protein APEM9 isoform X3 [Ricinus communis]|uniref:protein APEM9 isoform X3 n=1 Tax=Ricinus communis TaxID=3988 RepID=UPI00201ABFFB|nr:protein APEM9 isoform X3 [Ricinus communis]
MALMDSNPATWEEIERSESYLVASMYEEAASVASSVLNKICNKNSINSNVKDQGGEEFELNDMMLSAGMVLVQSLSQLGRGSDILKELKQLFMSVDAIPVQVLLTGVCFQISEGSLLGVREFLEEFLGKWNFVEGRHYVLVDARIDANLQEGYDKSSILGVDEYMEVAEIYAVTLLGTALKDLDLAISWVEKAALPEERQQDCQETIFVHKEGFGRYMAARIFLPSEPPSCCSTSSCCNTGRPVMIFKENKCINTYLSLRLVCFIFIFLSMPSFLLFITCHNQVGVIQVSSCHKEQGK